MNLLIALFCFMVRHHRSRYIRRTVVGSRCREVDVAALVRAQ
jgi:hypothetical protein